MKFPLHTSYIWVLTSDAIVFAEAKVFKPARKYCYNIFSCLFFPCAIIAKIWYWGVTLYDHTIFLFYGAGVYPYVIIFFKQSVRYRMIVFSIYIDQYYAVIMPLWNTKKRWNYIKMFKSFMYKKGLILI